MKLWLLIGLQILLGGCVQTKATSVPNVVQPNKAPNVIVARRHRFGGSAKLIYVVLEGETIAGLWPGERVEFHLNSGSYQLGAGCREGLFFPKDGEHQKEVVINALEMNVFTIGPDWSICTLRASSREKLSAKQLAPEQVVPVGTISGCGKKAAPKTYCFGKPAY